MDIELKQPGTCPVRSNFDPVPILGALSINPAELEYVRFKNGTHRYNDHKRKLQIRVVCNEAAPYYTVTFSSKYYSE